MTEQDSRFEPHLDDESYANERLQAAGARAEVPREIVERITEVAHSEWEARWARPTRGAAVRPSWPQDADTGGATEWAARQPSSGGRSAWQTLAIAAGVLVAITAGAWWWLGTQSSGALAVAERTTGSVSFESSEERPPAALVAGDVVTPGAWITTGPDGSAALRVADHLSVRIDRDSRLRFLTEVELELTRGAIYIDTGRGDASSAPKTPKARAITVATPIGSAWDLGTQFEVRLADPSSMTVRVREGEVAVESHDQRHRADAGEQLTVLANGSATTTAIDRFGDDWQWAVAIAPRLDIDGLVVGDFLDWVARENGWRVRFANPSFEPEARARILRGGYGEDTGADQAAQAALPAVGLEATLSDGVLTIKENGS